MIAALASALVVPAALAGGRQSGRSDLPGPLNDPSIFAAYQQVQLAQSSESAASRWIELGAYEAAGMELGSLRDSLAQLSAASKAVDGAGQAGLASAVRDHLTAATAKDNAAANSIRVGGANGLGDAQAAIAAAQQEKAAALSLLQYGEQITPVDLGCKLFFQQGGGDTIVGLDGCTSPVTKFEVQPWFMPSNYSNAIVTTGGSIPCILSGETIECTPSQPLAPGQDVYLAFSSPASTTQGRILAYASGGTAQTLTFLSGKGRSATDLGLYGRWWRVTPNGFTAPITRQGTGTLSVGNRYAFETNVLNYGNGTATNATVRITLPPQFTPDWTYPSTCQPSQGAVLCPMGTLDAGYGGTVIVSGKYTSGGAMAVTSSVTSDAAEPAQDPHPNSAKVPFVVYRVPNAKITAFSPGILSGRPGTLSGTVPTLAMQTPPEASVKVQVAVLQNSLVKGKCAWFNAAGGSTLISPVAGACSTGVWLSAQGTKKWRYTFARGLPSGEQYVLVRVTNRAGLTGSLFGTTLGNLKIIKVTKPK